MNKRIKELTEKAGFYIFNDKIYIPTTSEDITAYQKKFAELIVLECACIADDMKALGTAESIKQHFGVKE
jgi:hypothetical protein